MLGLGLSTIGVVEEIGEREESWVYAMAHDAVTQWQRFLA
jgi:hypothetical protein